MISPLTLGIALQVAAFLCFAALDTAAKWLVAAALPAIQVAFLRYAVHFGWALVLYLPRQRLGVFRSAAPLLQTLRALTLLGGTVLNFVALSKLPLTTTIAIFFASPLLVCLLSIPLLGERVGLRRFLAVITGFVGVLVIVRPWSVAFDPHVLYSLGAMISASLYFVLTRRVAGIDSNAVAQSYAAGLATVALVPVAFVVWSPPGGALDWLVVLLVGSFGMLGHSLAIAAHRHVEASVLAPMVYTQILWATLFGWLLFGDVPDAQTLLGAAIIVASGLYVWLRERRLAGASVSPAVTLR